MAPLDYLRRLKAYYSKENNPPPLSIGFVACLSIGFTALYVLPFYLSKSTRPSPTISRDSPAVIKARIRTVTLACALCGLATIYILGENVHPTSTEMLHLLGWFPISFRDTLRPLLLTALLFIGPLFERAIVESGWKVWITGHPLVETLGSWVGWRNFIAGPITEEFLFRSLLTPLSLLTSLTPKQTIFLTPLYFGIAHIHHFYEFTLTHPRVPLLHALINSLFQLAYTTLFGWYANFVFVRTGNLLTIILAHAFCNWMGLPRVWGRVEAGVPLGPPIDDVSTAASSSMKGRNGKAAAAVKVGNGELGIGWTVVYYVLLVAGAVGFGKSLWTLTESEGKLAEI